MNLARPLLIASALFLFKGPICADEPKEELPIKLLESQSLPKNEWKNVGFGTPQDTLQTFLWAAREGNTDMVLKSFVDKSPELTADDRLRIENAGEAAVAYKPIAIRTLADSQVELKFLVKGWKDKPFIHKFKKEDGEWKMDTSSSTRVAEW